MILGPVTSKLCSFSVLLWAISLSPLTEMSSLMKRSLPWRKPLQSASTTTSQSSLMSKAMQIWYSLFHGLCFFKEMSYVRLIIFKANHVFSGLFLFKCLLYLLNGSIKCTSYFTFWKCFSFTEPFRESSTLTVSGYTEHILKRHAVNSKGHLCSRPLPTQELRACPQPRSSPLCPRLRMRDRRVPLCECHHYIQCCYSVSWTSVLFSEDCCIFFKCAWNS